MKQINLMCLLCVVHCFVFAQKITYDNQIIYNKKQEGTLQEYPKGLLSYSYQLDNDTLILKISNFSKKTVITCNPCIAKGFNNELIDSQTKERLLLFHFFYGTTNKKEPIQFANFLPQTKENISLLKFKHGDNKVFKFLLNKKDLRYFNKNHFEFLAYLVEIPIEDDSNLQLCFSHSCNKGFIMENNPILKAMKKERKQIIRTISTHNCIMVVGAEKLFEMPKLGVISTIQKSNETDKN